MVERLAQLEFHYQTSGTLATPYLAVREGFEPPVVLPTLVFKTSAINRTRPSHQVLLLSVAFTDSSNHCSGLLNMKLNFRTGKLIDFHFRHPNDFP